MSPCTRTAPLKQPAECTGVFAKTAEYRRELVDSRADPLGMDDGERLEQAPALGRIDNRRGDG